MRAFLASCKDSLRIIMALVAHYEATGSSIGVATGSIAPALAGHYEPNVYTHQTPPTLHAIDDQLFKPIPL
jgi:hypothetical protein